MVLTITKVPDVKAPLVTVPWFLKDGGKAIVRHPLNDRKQLSVRTKYMRLILSHGIMEGCRGEAWLVEPHSPSSPWLALTFGTLSLEAAIV